MMSLLHDIRVISIHALAKRATTTARLFGYPLMISIHALAKRATSTATRSSSTCLFQSTPSQRGRLCFTLETCLVVPYFNPRPRKEGDVLVKLSGTPRGDFNPRPRKEGDLTDIRYFDIVSDISIHALAKRATYTP